MKKILVVALAAGAIALAGCGPKEPAPEVPVGEWSEVDDVAVRAWTAQDTLGVQVQIKNHRKSGEIDRHDIKLKSINGPRVDSDYASDSFEQEFVDSIPAGGTLDATFYTATTDHSDAAAVLTIEDQDFPLDLDPS